MKKHILAIGGIILGGYLYALAGLWTYGTAAPAIVNYAENLLLPPQSAEDFAKAAYAGKLQPVIQARIDGAHLNCGIQSCVFHFKADGSYVVKASDMPDNDVTFDSGMTKDWNNVHRVMAVYTGLHNS